MSDATRLGHGISVISLPLPFPSPKAVNCFVVEAETGLVLIDCGVDWEIGWRSVEEGLTSLGYRLSEVNTLIVSHLHPDHVGMAPRLIAETGCRFVMHKRAASLYRRYNDTPGFATRTQVLARQHGVPAALQGAFSDIGPRPDFMPAIGPPDVLVEDGSTIPLEDQRRLEVIYTPGHDPAHICLRDSLTGVVFSGDHVLGRITPVIMYDEDAVDPLGDYLDSLSKLIEIRIALTYPAHGSMIERGTQRCNQILLHHERRLSGMEDVVERGPVTAWTVMEAVFRPHLTPLEQRLALRETVAHLEHLRLTGRAVSFDSEGVTWYRPV